MTILEENRMNIRNLVIQKFWSKLSNTLLKEFNYDYKNDKTKKVDINSNTNISDSIVSSIRSALNDLQKKKVEVNQRLVEVIKINLLQTT